MDKRIRYIYEMKNKLNGKTYIGQHTVRTGRTITSDTYWGSGTILKEAIAKYGIENFEKTIIISGEFTKEEINQLEISEISKQRSLGKANYNISDGGESPFINSDFARLAGAKADPRKRAEGIKRARANESISSKLERYRKAKETYKLHGFKPKGNLGFHHREESKLKMSNNRRGERNGSFGKHWFTNGITNVKCKECPSGFYPGRV